MLRPPEYGQVLLANAQAEWFRSAAGRQSGWRQLKDALEAQLLANRGNLVVVVSRAPIHIDPDILRSYGWRIGRMRLLQENGPEIIQARQKNHSKTSTKVGFLAHPGAWPGGVRYYAHPIDH